MDEIWKPVPGFGDHYEASSKGNIRAKDRIVTKRHRSGKLIQQRYAQRMLTPCKTDSLGHLVVHIGVDGKKINAAVHRLVLLAFVGIPADGEEACHRNGVAGDNRPDNLRWGSHLSNNQDRVLHGTYLVGEKHKMAKLTEAQVVEIKESGLHYEEVSRRFGISRSQAHRICAGKSWKCVEETKEGIA